MDPRVVAVVGGGFSGTLTAMQLLRADPDIRVILIEKAARFARGRAYATSDPEHLLNVRVSNMSAWPDRPDHLRQWLATHAEVDLTQISGFITRQTYGRYLAEMLQIGVGEADGARRLLLVQDEAVRLRPRPEGFAIDLAMGRSLTVHAVVLAVGSPPPAPPRDDLGSLPAWAYSPNPWSPDALSGLDPAQPVILIGTGLTMVDVVLSLVSDGHTGPIWAISRHGLTPHEHAGAYRPRATASLAGLSLSGMVRSVRARSLQVGWRQAVDDIRPYAQRIWREASLSEQRRFLRHLRPWWDVHRHRVPPATAARIQRLRRSRRLRIRAGRIVDVKLEGDLVRLVWRRRGAASPNAIVARRIINCAGLGGNIREDPLLSGLVGSGFARADPLGLGLDVAADCRVLDAEGRPQARLFAVGPLTRGAFWEVVAVPDIRDQVADVAARVVAVLGALQAS